MDASGHIQFYLNGQKHEVADKFPATTSLNDYIREVAGLMGTKVMCKEAGCGCCAVTVTHALNGDEVETMSINSCVCPLYSVDGWIITTTEGLGSQRAGLHPIQQRIIDYNGSQCGYCTPGLVMAMYGFLHQTPTPTMKDIEGSLDGHLCRCTGYRSILDAMKSFGVDSPSAVSIDIEDLNLNMCPSQGRESVKKLGTSKQSDVCPRPLNIDLCQSRWFRPLKLMDLGKILQEHQNNCVKMVFGNTASGIFKHEGPYEVFIDLRSVEELHVFTDNKTSLVFGASTTIGKFRKRLIEYAEKPGFHYFPRVVRHLDVLANVLVRNAGSMAGNLMIKHTHPWFPSDLFTILEAIGAKVDIFDSKTGQTVSHNLMKFLSKVDMNAKVLRTIEVPSLSSQDHFRSFKITPRWQNSHAYINAAFKIPLSGMTVTDKPNIVFGGVSADMVHATETEKYLERRTLDDSVINAALKVLYEEIHPDVLEVGASSKYRRQLCVNLLYKTLLGLYQPGATLIIRVTNLSGKDR
ncbi:hypothetical protein RRG08_030072 [Elysia crispata]|uniref:FAD-binding PCMH-type domain-containing protein n=1 Tax=Elysia crispata TaxID=231223 RepID=A0AAE1CZQ2_9GAST|nr:hypothetical protein RRG08_030072 [Elysia crispata]